MTYGVARRTDTVTKWPEPVWHATSLPQVGPALQRLWRAAAAVPTPCQDRPEDWSSGDPEVRESAAHRCRDCPLLAPCRDALDENQPPWSGVILAGVLTGPGPRGPVPSMANPARLMRERGRLPLNLNVYDARRERGNDSARAKKRNRRAAEAAAARGDPIPRTTTPWKHGTLAGYGRHVRTGSPPCEDCANAFADAASPKRARALSEQRRYWANPEKARAVSREKRRRRYWADPERFRAKDRERAVRLYWADPEKARRAAREKRARARAEAEAEQEQDTA